MVANHEAALLYGLLLAFQSPGRSRLWQLECQMPKSEENAVLCSCFYFSCGQCHHCPEDNLDVGTQSRLMGEDSDGDLYGWILGVKPTWAYALSNAAHVVVVCGLKTQLHLHLCSMWSQCVPDHLRRWFGRSDHNPSSMHLGCIYTCTSMWSSTIQLQSNHPKCILIQGVKGVKDNALRQRHGTHDSIHDILYTWL